MVTAPLFFAMEDFPDIRRLAERRFESESDVSTALDYIKRSHALEKTEQYAKKIVDDALACLQPLVPSEALEALVDLANAVIYRRR